MDDQIVEEIYSADRTRRIVIFRRDSGTFYYQNEHFSTAEYENCWIPSRQALIGYYESQVTAAQEARGNVDWLASENK